MSTYSHLSYPINTAEPVHGLVELSNCSNKSPVRGQDECELIKAG
jgi:hypothetical protein